MVLAAPLACGFLAWRLRQPILLGYVLAGLLLSPLTPGLRVHDVYNCEVMAEIGVVLLMFSVGIEFSVPELLKVKWMALVGAPLGILLCVGFGMTVGGLLGWTMIQGVAVGCIISVALDNQNANGRRNDDRRNDRNAFDSRPLWKVLGSPLHGTYGSNQGATRL